MAQCRRIHAQQSRGTPFPFHNPIYLLQGAQDVFSLHAVQVARAVIRYWVHMWVAMPPLG